MFDIKNYVIGALLMLKKYTIFNIKFYANTDDEDYIAGIHTLPLIGIIMGLISLIFSLLSYIYNDLFTGLILVIYFSAITNLSNLKETVHSIKFICKNKNDINIYIQVIIVIILFTYYTLFTVLPAKIIALMPIVGYSTLIISSNFFKRTKSNTSIIKFCNKAHISIAFIVSFLATLIISYRSAIALSATYCICISITCIADLKIKILPSSVEGMLIEISQILFLFFSYILFLY